MSSEPCKWPIASVFAIHTDLVRQLNLEDVVDLILEPSVFMVVTATFSHTTLDALHQEEPLSTEEAGFVMGQIFVALKYLHDCDLAHGNLDPRSIRVMSRKRLWIKLTDTAISNCFDLGKPEGYHATYTSQHFGQADKSPADIWSAGVVALQLLHGLPSRTGGNIIHQALWVAKLERHAKSCDQQSGTDASDTVRMVLKHAPEARPTATEVLRHQWILRTRGDIHVNNTHFNLPDPEGSRPTSVAPSASFSRHTSRQSSRQGSAPPLPVSRQSSVPLSELTPAQVLERMEEAEKLGGDYIDPDIDWNMFDSPSGSVRSQSVDGGVQTPAIDWKTGNVGRVEGQRQAGIEDSGEETETGRRKPITKKPRKGKAVPPHPMNLRSRVTPSSNSRLQRSATPRSPGYPGVTPTKSRHTSVKPSDSISRQFHSPF